MSNSRGPKNWWQAGLAWGTTMFVFQAIKAAFDGRLTLNWTARDLLVWEAAGLAFGVLLTAVLSVLFSKNLFRGFGEGQEGNS
jgi:hypothetical protein